MEGNISQNIDGVLVIIGKGAAESRFMNESPLHSCLSTDPSGGGDCDRSQVRWEARHCFKEQMPLLNEAKETNKSRPQLDAEILLL